VHHLPVPLNFSDVVAFAISEYSAGLNVMALDRQPLVDREMSSNREICKQSCSGSSLLSADSIVGSVISCEPLFKCRRKKDK
jgi:hypothetical protein